MVLYRLNVSEISKDSELRKLDGNSHKQKQCFNYENILHSFDIKTKAIDGDKIQEYFFNKGKYDIFLSHSSQDIEEVKKLQQYLENKNFKVFVDSMVWGNYKEIFKKIEQEFKKMEDNENEYVFAHLHIMLLSALENVIKNTNYFIFIDSKSSIDITNDITKIYSPWIFYELNVANNYYSPISIHTESLTEGITIGRNVSSFIGNFKSITAEKFKKIFNNNLEF